MDKNDTLDMYMDMLGATNYNRRRTSTKMVTKEVVASDDVEGYISLETVNKIIQFGNKIMREKTYQFISTVIFNNIDTDKMVDWNKVEIIIKEWMDEWAKCDEELARSITKIKESVEKTGFEVIYLPKRDKGRTNNG